VRAAIAIVPAVGRLALPQAAELDVRVGIASGQVVVGDLLGEGMAQEAAVEGCQITAVLTKPARKFEIEAALSDALRCGARAAR